MRHAVPRLGVVALAAALLGACGEDDPTALGSDQRSAPDTLRVTELVDVVEDSVFHLPNTLGASPTGQIGAQKLYTTHLLLEFRVPTFVVDEGDTLDLGDGRLEIGFTDAPTPDWEGAMLLSVHEVAPDGRAWSPDSIEVLPELQPGAAAAQDTVQSFNIGVPDFDIELDVDPKALVGFDVALANRESLEVNVACLFTEFTEGGPGFIEFPYRNNAGGSNVRFVGNYSTPQTTGIERSFASRLRLTIVEFDSTHVPGERLVASDGYRLHSYLRFADVRTVLPESAFVHAADLILVQADLGDTLFGTGPDIGIVVPSDTTMIFSKEQNERALGFRTSIVALPGSEVSISISAYLFDQQEGTVSNRGMLLRLSNEGTKARHFEFYGADAVDPARRPRIRIVYGMPADFGGGAP